jgi:TctA family transporter
MAAWVSYAMSKRFSKEPEKFGTGHVEGLVEAGASNNASIASGSLPAPRWWLAAAESAGSGSTP